MDWASGLALSYRHFQTPLPPETKTEEAEAVQSTEAGTGPTRRISSETEFAGDRIRKTSERSYQDARGKAPDRRAHSLRENRSVPGPPSAFDYPSVSPGTASAEKTADSGAPESLVFAGSPWSP